MVFEVELLQGEGEEGQGIAASAFFDVRQQTLGQLRLDSELAADSATRRAGPSITSL